MAFDKLTDHLKETVNHTEEYITTTAAYYKLSVFKQAMTAVTNIIVLSIRGLFALVITLFLSLGIAVFIGEKLENYSRGFFIVGGFYCVVFILVFVFARKPIERLIIKESSKLVFEEESTKLKNEQNV